MGTPFLGEIKIVGFNFPPKGWALCNGQQLPINQNQPLFSLFGTMYGGNGQTTFALPDLRGRTPIHLGAGFTQGQAGGQEFHTVTMSEMPAHTHFVTASSLGPAALPGGGDPTNSYWTDSGNNNYSNAPDSSMNPSSVTNVGGSQAHENRQPFLVVNFCVALIGAFPSQN
jgi:microcystin-dependent protein